MATISSNKMISNEEEEGRSKSYLPRKFWLIYRTTPTEERLFQKEIDKTL
jgi:hypothetical protein